MKEFIAVFLNQFAPVSEEILNEVITCFKEVKFQRKDIVTWEGDVEKYLYIILEGVQRAYYVKDGKEYVMAFTYPPSFSGIPDSFIKQRPSHYFLECLTDVKVLKISYEELNNLTQKYPAIEHLLRKVTEEFLVGMMERHHELLVLSIEDRFRVFMKRSGHLTNLISHKHIASYLGINPTNFSKLLNSVKI